MIEEEFRPEEKQSLKKKFKIRKTLASMIRQRGYFHPQQQLNENETWEEFEAKYRSDNVPGEYIFFKNGDDSKRLLIRFYTKQGPLTLDDAKKTMNDVQRYQVNTIIMVFPSDPYAAKPIMVDKKARLWIEQVNSIGQEYSFELFGEDDLVYDVTKHELVPQHIILSTEEKKQLLVKYRVNENQLPRILQTDPISKFLGLHHGDVVKIIRKSETAGVYVTYRIVM